MDAGGRATQDAKAEDEERSEAQHVMPPPAGLRCVQRQPADYIVPGLRQDLSGLPERCKASGRFFVARTTRLNT